MTRLKPNTCDAPGCNLTIPRGQLMCRAHWFGTPTPLRRAISDSWKAKRITEWSGHCFEARKYHAGTTIRRDAVTANSTRKRES